MTTNFFTKKRWLYIGLSQLLACFVLICLLYSVYLNQVSTVWVGKSFYFLVSENEHVEVATHEAHLDGGAGYLLEHDGKEYIAWAVYLNDADGKAVQTTVEEKTQILKKNVEYLCFKGKKKKEKSVYQGALNTLYGCIEVLSQGISRLDHGGTQQACKRILSVLERQFSYLATTYQNSYPAFSNVCANVHKQLQNILNDTVYGKDLRYVLCGVSEEYIRLSADFSI